MEKAWLLVRDAAMFVANLLYPIVRSLRQNSGLAVLSIVLAFGVWIVVTDAENPETTQVLEGIDIPVEAINVPSVVAVESIEPSTIRVRVRVEEDVLDTLIAADFEATVDLQGFTVGQYERPVMVRPLTSRGGLRVEEVIPSEVTVTIVQVLEKRVPVVIEVDGDPPPGYRLSLPETDEELVTVAGPQSKVRDVTQATATLNVEGLTETFEQAVRLEARDARGLLVTGVSVDPALVQVTIEIQQEVFSRPLPIAPDIQGAPAEGYAVVSVSVEPAVVTAIGPRFFIESATLIDTEPIDIEGENSDLVTTVDLNLPASVEVPGGESRVTVTILIRPQEGERVFTVPVTITNVPAGLSVTGTLPSISVTVSGSLPDLLDLTASDVVATVDLEGRSAGAVQVAIEATVPDDFEVESISPERVTITLTQP